MRKVLVGFLILASAAGVFAQEETKEEKQGLTWSGAVKTGLQFKTSNEKDAQGDTHGPWFDLYNDDAGERTRIDLDLAYTKDNYGAVIGLRTNDPFALPTVDLFRQGYVWAEFAKLVNVKAGKIDDAAWATTGPEEFSEDTGGGLRVEIKPIAGLNVGFFINGPDDWYYHFDAGANAHLAEDFFLETAFGVKYEHSFFDVAAGLRLDGKGDPLYTDDDHYDKDALAVSLAKNNTNLDDKENDWVNKGMMVWVGFGLKAVKNLTFTVEGKLANLGGFGDYGWVWLNEVIKYAIITDKLTAGIRMDQFIYGNSNTEQGQAGHNPWLRFRPEVSYALTEAWIVGLKIPIAFQLKETSYDIGIQPTVSYKLGENTSIEGFYLFDIRQPEKDAYRGDAAESVIKNTVQIDFIWKF